MKKKTLASFGIVALLSGIPAPGAVYNVEPSNAQAVQDALWQVAVDGEPGEVVVPAGTYVVSEALRIYPGTTLTLDSEAVVLYRGAPSGVMLIGCHFDSKGWPCSGAGCTHGGYSQCHDVVVQGGFWNRNSSSDELSQAFLFRHASGIVIRDMEVANCSNHHFNLSGSEEVVVDNICFPDKYDIPATTRHFGETSSMATRPGTIRSRRFTSTIWTASEKRAPVRSTKPPAVTSS